MVRHFCRVGDKLFKITLIAATLIAASAASFAQTAATPAPAKPVTAAAPAAAPAPAPAAAATPAKPATAAAPAGKATDAAPAVKKSNNDICHDESSPGYKATKNFKPFATMDECIKSGGRAPKTPDAKAKK